MKSHRLITEGGTNTPVTNINSKSSESLHFNPNLPENFKRFNNILQAAPSHVKTLSCQQQHCSTVGGGDGGGVAPQSLAFSSVLLWAQRMLCMINLVISLALLPFTRPLGATEGICSSSRNVELAISSRKPTAQEAAGSPAWLP